MEDEDGHARRCVFLALFLEDRFLSAAAAETTPRCLMISAVAAAFKDVSSQSIRYKNRGSQKGEAAAAAAASPPADAAATAAAAAVPAAVFDPHLPAACSPALPGSSPEEGKEPRRSLSVVEGEGAVAARCMAACCWAVEKVEEEAATEGKTVEREEEGCM